MYADNLVNRNPSKPKAWRKTLWMRDITRLTPSCRDVTRIVSDQMDRGLPFGLRLATRLHLALCVFCRRYHHQLHLLRRGAQFSAQPREPGITPSLTPAAADRIKSALGRES